MNQIIVGFSLVIVLNFLATSFAEQMGGDLPLKKCCSKTRILNEDLECVPLISDEMFESDIFSISGGNVSYNNRDLCPNNVTYIQLISNFDNEIIYCVDKLINETRGQELIVGLSCLDTTLRDHVENVQIFTLHKCCPRYYQYNQFKQCVYLAGIDFASKLVSSLFENNIFNIQHINMRYGMNDSMNSNDVVTDYETLRSRTNYLASESLKIVYKSEVIEHGDNFKGVKFTERIIPFDHACIDIIEDNTEHYVVRTYESYNKICSSRNCIRKCCKQGYSMVNSKKCTKSKQIFNPKFNTVIQLDNSFDNETSEDYSVKYGDPFCPSNQRMLINLSRGEDYFSFPNGTLRGDVLYRDIDYYCMEHVFFPKKNYNHIVPFLCSPTKASGLAPHDSETKYLLVNVFLIISTVFAFTTLLVYAILPFLHKNIHGKCLMCYFICVCLFCSCMCFVRINASLYKTNKSLCFTMGILTNFSILATFTWLNVICFDIWNKFRNIRAKSISQSHVKKFLLYNTYAWGIPALITLLMYIAQYHDTWFLPDNRANFAVENCWFQNPKSNLSMKLFNIVPLTTFIAINITLFCVTAYHCTNTKNQIQRMKSGVDGDKENLRSMFNSYKVKLSLNLKLFLGMGVFWICDLIQRYVNIEEATFILDIITSAQGILIFGLFIAKHRIWKQLVALYEREVLGMTQSKKGASRSTTMTVFTVNSSVGGSEGGHGDMRSPK